MHELIKNVISYNVKILAQKICTRNILFVGIITLVGILLNWNASMESFTAILQFSIFVSQA